MNERWGVDPAAGQDERDWRYLLDKFGPYTGRYILRYPGSWLDVLRAKADSLPDPRSAALKRLIARAEQEKKVLRMKSSAPYDELQPWLTNLEACTSLRGGLQGVIVERVCKQPYYDLDSFSPPPSASTKIPGKDPQAFVRAAEALLLMSPSLYFVDPLFNPTKKGHRDVMTALLRVAISSGCESVDIWVQESSLLRAAVSDQELVDKLGVIEKDTHARQGWIRMHLVDDHLQWDEEFHDRYVFSEYGGIEFSRGFQPQSQMAVKVMPAAIHKDHLEAFPRGRMKKHVDRVLRTGSTGR